MVFGSLQLHTTFRKQRARGPNLMMLRQCMRGLHVHFTVENSSQLNTNEGINLTEVARMNNSMKPIRHALKLKVLKHASL